MGGAFTTNEWGSCWFWGAMLTKALVYTLSNPRMTTGFGPFELPTHGLLKNGRDHSPPMVCFVEPSFWLAHTAMGIHSVMNIQITNNWGWGSIGGVTVILTKGMGEQLTYGRGASTHTE